MSSTEQISKRDLCALKIIIKRNDELNGKRLEALIINLLKKSGVAGSTVWIGVDGFGKRGKSVLRWEGVAVNMPLIIETVDEQSKIEPLLREIKRIVGDNGLVTINEVSAL